MVHSTMNAARTIDGRDYAKERAVLAAHLCDEVAQLVMRFARRVHSP
jgi:hypothetical protein